MKKIFLFFAITTLFIVSCEKEELLIEQDNQSESVATLKSTVSSESDLKTAIKNAKAGDYINISGTIYLTSTLQCLNSGKWDSKIKLNGGTLDCSKISSGWGVKLNGSYWDITNLTIKNSPDCGIVLQHGGNNWLYNVTTHDNKDSGIQIYNGSSYNWVEKCTSYDNYDSQNGGENADGFACKLSGGEGNRFVNCVADHNSDDGWDLYGQPYTVKMDYCTAKNHGYGTNGDGNGFKLGSAGQNVSHSVYYCTSSYNKASGYDGNGNTGQIWTTGSGGTGNGKALWYRVN